MSTKSDMGNGRATLEVNRQTKLAAQKRFGIVILPANAQENVLLAQKEFIVSSTQRDLSHNATLIGRMRPDQGRCYQQEE